MEQFYGIFCEGLVEFFLDFVRVLWDCYERILGHFLRSHFVEFSVRI